MIMTDDMFICASDIPVSNDDEVNRLRSLQRIISEDIGRNREQEVLTQKYTKALKEAFAESYDENKLSWDSLLRDFVKK